MGSTPLRSLAHEDNFPQIRFKAILLRCNSLFKATTTLGQVSFANDDDIIEDDDDDGTNGDGDDDDDQIDHDFHDSKANDDDIADLASDDDDEDEGNRFARETHALRKRAIRMSENVSSDFPIANLPEEKKALYLDGN